MNTINTPLLFAADQTPPSDKKPDSTPTRKATLGMNDFLKLLAAQFENQDINNPTSNTEFISELAQFSSLSAMNALAKGSDKQYAASLIGKKVTVTSTDDEDKTSTYIGNVLGVTTSGDTPQLALKVQGSSDPKYCDLSDVTAVGTGDDNTNIQGMLMEIAQYSDNRYAASLIGKTVEVQSKGSDGKITKSQGVVKSTAFSNGDITLTVNCNGTDGTYNISDITKVFGNSNTSSSGT